RVLATDRRLLVWHDSAWASVWYDAIGELHPATEDERVDLTFENDPPYSLTGPWAPYITVVLTTALATRRGIAVTVASTRLKPVGEQTGVRRPDVTRRCSLYRGSLRVLRES